MTTFHIVLFEKGDTRLNFYFGVARMSEFKSDAGLVDPNSKPYPKTFRARLRDYARDISFKRLGVYAIIVILFLALNIHTDNLIEGDAESVEIDRPVKPKQKGGKPFK